GDDRRVPGRVVLAVDGEVAVGVFGRGQFPERVVDVGGGVGAGGGAGGVAVGVGDRFQVAVGVVAERPQTLLRGEDAGQVGDVVVRGEVVAVGGVGGVGGGVVVGLRAGHGQRVAGALVVGPGGFGAVVLGQLVDVVVVVPAQLGFLALGVG